MVSLDELVTPCSQKSLEWVVCCGVLGSNVNGTHEKYAVSWRIFPSVFMRCA